jgi:hypothetical protein
MDSNFHKRVTHYVDTITEIIKNQYFSDIEKYKHLLLEDTEILKEEYLRKKEKILSKMLELCGEVKYLEEFRIALFSWRGTSKILMYKNDMQYYSSIFKICNKVFIVACNVKNDLQKVKNDISLEQDIIKNIMRLAYVYFYNMCRLNELMVNIDKEKIDVFYKRLSEVSDIKGDMHSYKIRLDDLRKYLISQKIDDISYSNNMNKAIGQEYYSEFCYKHDCRSRGVLERNNLNIAEDDMIIIEKTKLTLINEKLASFITLFSANNHKEIEIDENELVFSYFGENEKVYISKQLLNNTQEIIKKFADMCQYVKLVNYYYRIDKIKANKNSYDKGMTYKIADWLCIHKYILPYEIKTINGQKLHIPRVELQKIVKSVNTKELGDIDVLFYSPYTKILYNLEYKNYQMLVTEEGDLHKEIQKVFEDKVVEKSLRRQQFVNDNLQEITEKFFKLNKTDINSIETIILTTKPNLYFYVFENIDYKYYEWNEFKEKVLNKEL